MALTSVRSEPGGPAGDVHAPDERPRTRRTLLAFVAAAVALVLLPLGASRLVSQPEGDVHVFEIPAGTAARLAAGEPVEVLPADLDLALRDRLVLVNLDEATHQVGPFTVAPGERLERRFSEAVSFSGFCSLHPGGQLSIEVRPPS